MSFFALALLSIASAYTADATSVVSRRIRVVNWREESSRASEGVALCSLVARGTMSSFYSAAVHGISISTEAVRQECRQELSRLGTAILPALTEEVRTAELPNAAALFALLHDVAPGCPGEPVDSFLKRLDQLDDKYWEEQESTLLEVTSALADSCKERNLEMVRTVLNHWNVRLSDLERLVPETTAELTEVANTGTQSNGIKALYLLVVYAPSRPPNEWTVAKLSPLVTLSSRASQEDREVAFHIVEKLGHEAEVLRPELEELIISLATSANEVTSGLEKAIRAFMATGPATAAIAAQMPRLLKEGYELAFFTPLTFPLYTTLPVEVLLSVPQLTDDEVDALAHFAIAHIVRPSGGLFTYPPFYASAVLELISKKYTTHPETSYVAALYLACRDVSQIGDAVNSLSEELANMISDDVAVRILTYNDLFETRGCRYQSLVEKLELKGPETLRRIAEKLGNKIAKPKLWPERRSGIVALGFLGPSAAVAVPALIECLDDLEERYRAKEVLIGLGSLAEPAVAVAASEKRDSFRRQAAREILSEIRSRTPH